MSYPKNLSSRIQYLNNFSTNNVKINPSNSATGLNDISTGGDIVIDLPPNSMCDFSGLISILILEKLQIVHIVDTSCLAMLIV